MSNPNLSNPEKLVNEARLNEYHQTILPYLGGHIECGFTPVGAVIMMSGNEAPKHYLKCDGTVYNIADYPELAAFYARSQGSCNFYGGNGTTTFAVPDLRGEFLRGTGTNSHTNNGNGANVGVHQDATQYPKIAEWANTDVGFAGLNGVNSGIRYSDSDVNTSETTRIWKKMTVSSTGSTAGTDLMTFRPTNTSVLFCVATKNIYLDARFDYSLEEKVVGEWIDGKTLYQKTIDIDLSQITRPSATTEQWVDLIALTSVIPNIDTVMIDDSGSYFMYGNTMTPLTVYHGTNMFYVTCIAGVDNTIRVKTCGSSWFYSALGASGNKYVITLRYTKTTDA